ncbi:MAG: ROK family protein [Lachnospiraceae bacterium]|nr:ROK family protein [Lachnospiraceae bacterium]
MKIGALEAGGTKMVCAIGDENGKIEKRVSYPTQTPQETIPQIMEFFGNEGIQALGIGCFGPVELNRKSPVYGYITSTPKLAWANYPMAGTFAKALGIPVGFDTDVNGAALGEVVYGAAKGCDTAIYITVGTGVGVGVYANGALLHGLVHPEAGHMLITRRHGDTYRGKCPYHENCLEGLAAGPAIMERWGKPAAELADRKEVWELESDYLAQAVANYILTLSPQKVVLGGGVMHQEQMFPLVRKKVQEKLNSYLQNDTIQNHMEEYIIPPALGDNAGITGALLLGLQEFGKLAVR